MKKVWSVISSILTVVILIVAIGMTTMVILSTRNEDGIPSLFGYSLFNVMTDSMVGPDGFDPKTMIVVKKLTTDEINHDLKPGDVITYRRYLEGEPYLDSHRIVPITDELIDVYGDSSLIQYMRYEVVDGVWIHGGYSNYITKGDHEQDIDYVDGGFEYANQGNIIGVWTGIKIPYLGGIIEFMQSTTGFMVCIVIPVALFFIYELYVFIMTLTRKQKEDALAEVADKEAELKAAAVAEFLAQQQAAQAANTSPDPPAAAAAPPQAPAAPANDAPAADAPVADAPVADVPAADAAAASAPSAPNLSEEDKQRIIQEYLAKQQNPEA